MVARAQGHPDHRVWSAQLCGAVSADVTLAEGLARFRRHSRHCSRFPWLEVGRWRAQDMSDCRAILGESVWEDC